MLRTARQQLLLLAALGSPVATISAQARATSGGGANVRASIESVNARYMDMFNKGDVAGFARVYDDDAAVLAPNMETVHGQSAIAKWWQGGWDAGLRNVKLTTVEVFPHGNEATEVGTYELEMPMADGNIAHDHGKFIVLWRRNAKGEWKWHRDIYNSDVATPASAASSAKKDSTR